MNQHPQKLNSLSSLVAACSLGTSGVKVFAVLPLLLGVIAQHLALDEAQTGLVASYYYGAYFLATLTSVIWIRRISWRTLTFWGGGIMVVGLLISVLFNNTFEGVVGGIMLSGLGAAMVYALSVSNPRHIVIGIACPGYRRLWFARHVAGISGHHFIAHPGKRRNPCPGTRTQT